MKKIWFMLLLVCSACAFTACSDDDNEIPLSERITGIDMPKEIVLGEKAEIKAKGFATTAKLALENKAQGTVELEDAKFTETMVTFTVPEDILIETYSVILTQEGEKCTLGEVKVVDKPNPIEGLEVPGKIMIGDDAIVTGKGFNETSKLIFTNEEHSFTVELSQTSENATFTVPAETPIGIYSVSLSQNDWTWELGITTEVVEKITSLQMPARIYIGKEAKIFGEGFNTTNNQLILKSSTGESIDINNEEFTETYVSFTVPNNLTKGEFYNVVLINGTKEWPLGEVEAINPITKRITQITYYDEDETPWSWSLQYDVNNRISQITTSLYGEETVYKIEYTTDNKVTVSSEYENYSYTIAGNRVATSESIDEGFSYTWNYTAENYLSSINDNDDAETIFPYDFTDRNLVSVNYSELEYSNPGLINYLEIGDPVACICNFFLQAMDNHQFFSFLLGISGNHSAHLPSNLGADYGNDEIVYEGEDYITSASTSNYDEFEDATYTKKIVFEYEDYND